MVSVGESGGGGGGVLPPSVLDRNHRHVFSLDEDVSGGEEEEEDDSVHIAMDFEVFGKVQGVFFRKFTKKHAEQLGLVGWCRNSNRGTVVGQVQGRPSVINEMKKWLRSTGSPKSKIKNLQTTERKIGDITFQEFVVKK